MTEQAEASAKRRLSGIWRNIAALFLCVACYYLAPIRLADTNGIALIGFVAGLAALTALIVREIRRLAFGSMDDIGLGPLLLAVYLAVVLFAAVYYRLADSPGQISGLETKTDALYFTLVTLATVGYGDIWPTSQAARVVAMIQIVFNLVVIAGAVSVIGGLFRRRVAARRHGENGDPSPG